MMVTIITPIYNRAALLTNIYDSLCKQTNQDFEWIIVDDGSEDDVREVAKNFSLTNFPIRLYYKENGGKHTAVNLGVREAKGILILILDSDDELPCTAIEEAVAAYQSIDGNNDFAGVCGYMSHRDGRVIGHPLVRADVTEVEMRYGLHVCGDMCEVFRTDVLREYPFPEIKGERFCPECLVWNRIARRYRLHVFPKIIYWRDYLDGGLTDNIVRIRMKSPICSMMTYAELINLNIPWRQKVKAAVNFYRFKACLSMDHIREVDCDIPSLRMLWIWTKPLGMLMHMLDINR